MNTTKLIQICNLMIGFDGSKADYRFYHGAGMNFTLKEAKTSPQMGKPTFFRNNETRREKLTFLNLQFEFLCPVRASVAVDGFLGCPTLEIMH